MKLENEVSIVRYKASTSVLRFWCLLSGHPTIGQALGAESTKKKKILWGGIIRCGHTFSMVQSFNLMYLHIQGSDSL